MPKGTKILMVDDDKMLIDLYKERLELAGYTVEISRDGEECLAKIHQVKPDLVLLDIMMPKVSGYETLASIKSDPATKDIPVIILSALMRDINKTKAIESGADDYIIKSEAMPVDVIQKIEAVLKKYHKDVPSSPSVEPSPQPAADRPMAEVPPSSLPSSPPPPATTSGPPPASPEIQFEPFDSAPSTSLGTSQGKPAAPKIGGTDIAANAPAVVPPPIVVPEAPAAPIAVPPVVPAQPLQPMPMPQPKPSPTVVFFLVLIVILILASDLFFYMKCITGK